MIGELQLVFIVRDKGAIRKLGFTYTLKYTETIVKLLQYCQYESSNLVHDIVKVELWPISIRRSL